MKFSGSILKIVDNKEKIKEMINCGIDYLHLDVMDGEFVSNKTLPFNECLEISKLSSIPLDVHLMVQNPLEYIYQFEKIKPSIITFHIETTNNPIEIINFLKEKNINVGIAINPETSISSLLNYLDKIDLVLLMSVKPGMGGQALLENTYSRLEELNKIRKEHNLEFLIEVDGGINEENVQKIAADIIVLGSYITNSSDYSFQLKKIGDML